MGRTKKLAVAAVVGANACLAATQGGTLAAWAVDPHVKVFRDAPPLVGGGAHRLRWAPVPRETGVVKLRAARNEFEPGQLAFRSTTPLKGVRIELSPLRHADGKGTIGGDDLAWNFLGFIPLKKNTQDSDKIQLRAAPCEVPDPLLDARTLDVAADATQPVWLTVRVPKDAPPGLYRGEAVVVAGDTRAAVPIELSVDPFALPDVRHLLVTNWFDASHFAKAHNVAVWSDAFWPILERYARNMAAHRQNVALTPWSLVQITREADGKLSFDYARFDRYIELFQKAGVADGIELTHVGSFGPGGWGSKEIVLVKVGATDRKTGKRVELGPEEGLAPLLADLEKHLEAKGWLAKTMIHVADEPSLNNLASWRKASEFVHKAAPRIRRIDAIESVDFTGALEVWVPKLSHFDRWRDAYEARRVGNEFWYYICCHPFGNLYPNRFLDYPLARVRVLHWLNFACGLTGYLHWGLTFWGDDPFGPPSDRLPPGDTHVIYPGADGPLNSIRWEIQRESIEDFEYLCLLAVRTAEAKKRLGPAADFVDPRRRAIELCREIVPAIADTERDPARIMAVRAEIAEEIISLGGEPLLLAETEPMAGSTLVHGPICVELRGVTQPGASVKINGTPVAVGPDGCFATHVSPRGTRHEVRIEAEHNGRKAATTRRFQARR
ncbi:MAG: DUF4091 domain-containing protein [Planctomycetes bacterium]|nr:DUF4091 domain-containing protein [Planctomycetota bacterium]